MKIKIRAAFDERDFMICQDTGTGRALVSYVFLANFSDVDITKVSKPARIAGYLGPVMKFQEWAIWTYYVLGVRCDRTPGIAQFHVGVWIIDKLDVNLLLSNVALYERKA